MSKSRDIADSAATINYIDTVTSNVQDQIDNLDPLPSQTGNSGKYLTTDGTDASWGTVTTDPTLGTLTKTFASGESASISLTSSVLAPVVSVIKEVPQSGSTNNSWDVNSTTENYTRLDSAAATTLNWVGGNVSTATVLANIAVGSGSDPIALAFNLDGTKMYVADYGDKAIYSFTLTTAWDITTKSTLLNSFSLAGQSGNPHGMCFNSDGTIIFTAGYTANAINKYLCSTAFDITTASYSQTLTGMNGPTGVQVNSTGTKLYVSNDNNSDIREWDLSTAYDLSTAAYNSVSLSVTQPRGMAFNDNGETFYALRVNGIVYEYSLSTGFSLSSASLVTSYDDDEDNNMRGIAFKSDFLKMFLAGSNNDKVYSYTLGKKLALGTGSFASADVGYTIEANSGAFLLTATDGSIVETTAPTSYAQVASGDWSMYGVVYNTVDGDLELSGVLINGFDVSLSSFVDGFSVASQETSPKGVAFNTDGTKMFVIGDAGVNEYTLSIGFDVSTATYSQNFSVSSQEAGPEDLAFNTDGTKMFVLGSSGREVNEYTLSTGFDISTAAYDSVFSVSGQDADPTGLAFSADGTYMFVSGNTGDSVYKYTLSTGFDVSTASYTNAYSVSSQESNTQGVAFNSDGTKMFICGTTGDDVNEYTLSTAYDPATSATFVDSFSVSAQDGNPTGLTFNADGTKMFVVGAANNTIFEYTVGTLAAPSGYQPVHTTLSTDTTYWTDINSMTANQAAGSGNIYYAISTDDRTTWSVIKDVGGERDIVRNNSGTWQYNSNSTYASETWVNGATNTELATLAEAMEGAALVSGFNIADTGSVESSFSVSPFAQPNGVRFNTDGTKMFIMGYSIDEVRQYSLSTAYDVSTSSYDNVSFSISSTAASSRGFNFNSDGSKMYVVDSSLDSVVEYDLSTGFDLSTASYNSVSFDISSELAEPQDIVFNNNGTKMYIVGFSTDTVFQYSLSTAYDVSTASYDSVSFSVAGQSSTPTSLYFSNDGLFLFVLGYTNTRVYQYNLTTAYDISTASYSGTSESIANEPNPRGLTFNNNGTKMYVVGNGNDTVYQWPVGTTTSYTNQMDKTQLDAVTDPNHIALGNDLDLAIVFNMTSGSTVPSSDGVAINYDANVLNKGAVLGTDYDFDAPAQNSVRITALAANNLKVRVV